jgi:biotin transport system substrate-specific component
VNRSGEIMQTISNSSVSRSNSLLLKFGAVVAANFLLIASAKIQIAFWPVPMTMQTLVVVGLGLALGFRLGLAAICLYLVEGAIGLPVLAGTPERGIGLAYMVGPTGGYLLGFVLATAIVGLMAERGLARGIAGATMAVLVGHAVILALGAAWLASFGGWQMAWMAGTVPFLLGTVLKSAIAVLLARPFGTVRERLR